ncbi:MAG: YggT family protein [Clostridia bacterium]|nr:YggT family protein [Clostridia bacterium]
MNNFAYVLLYLFTGIIDVLLSVVLMLMFLRAILSWLPLSDDNPIEEFAYRVTEPFILPVRLFVERSDTLSSLPIDISFFISFILLSIAADLLSSIGV